MTGVMEKGWLNKLDLSLAVSNPATPKAPNDPVITRLIDPVTQSLQRTSTLRLNL